MNDTTNDQLEQPGNMPQINKKDDSEQENTLQTSQNLNSASQKKYKE